MNATKPKNLMSLMVMKFGLFFFCAVVCITFGWVNKMSDEKSLFNFVAFMGGACSGISAVVLFWMAILDGFEYVKRT